MSASPRPSPDAPVKTGVFLQRRPLPALGLPRAREDRRAGAILSLVLHVLIVVLLVTPFAVHHEIVEREQGAGGLGPAGGGGGGKGGTGGVRDESERLQYVAVQPAAAPAPAPTPTPQIVQPVPTPPPEPPKIVETPKVETNVTAIAPAKVPDVSLVPGAGGGSGSDGSKGSGPGSGGGVGSGIGTGRGSGVGAGTGGGTQQNYPPQPIEVGPPPMPVPGKVRGAHIIAEFDVDSTGRVLTMDFTRTKDGGYNKLLEDAFRSVRFRPGTSPDGRPLRMKAQIEYILP